MSGKSSDSSSEQLLADAELAEVSSVQAESEAESPPPIRRASRGAKRRRWVLAEDDEGEETNSESALDEDGEMEASRAASSTYPTSSPSPATAAGLRRRVQPSLPSPAPLRSPSCTLCVQLQSEMVELRHRLDQLEADLKDREGEELMGQVSRAFVEAAAAESMEPKAEDDRRPRFDRSEGMWRCAACEWELQPGEERCCLGTLDWSGVPEPSRRLVHSDQVVAANAECSEDDEEEEDDDSSLSGFIVDSDEDEEEAEQPLPDADDEAAVAEDGEETIQKEEEQEVVRVEEAKDEEDESAANEVRHTRKRKRLQQERNADVTRWMKMERDSEQKAPLGPVFVREEAEEKDEGAERNEGGARLDIKRLQTGPQPGTIIHMLGMLRDRRPEEVIEEALKVRVASDVRGAGGGEEDEDEALQLALALSMVEEEESKWKKTAMKEPLWRGVERWEQRVKRERPSDGDADDDLL